MPTADSTLLTILTVLPFAGSLIAGFFRPNGRKAEAWLAGAVSIAALAIVLWYYPNVAAGDVIRSEIAWIPEYGLTLSFRMDGFAWMFAGLISAFGFLVVLYARYYMSSDDPVPRFFSFLLAFMGAMLGVVLSGNLIQLVLFWELTSLFSFLLIGYWHHNASARDGARVALTVTAAGGLCLFGGVLIIGAIVESFDLDKVLASGDIIRAHPLYLTALVLVLLGALTKSAQFPFHFWLPRAMAAPTPVSAYLHSATMVKAGVFLLARLWPALGGTDYWLWIVGSAGLATFIIGAYLAIFQQDLKGLLAYSTISHLGLITLLIGLDRPLGIVAAIFHIANHATFKASLFMAAGIIDHETGTRDIRKLSGLYRYMPVTGTLAMVAAAAMAGVPLLNGFLSKEMFFAETIENHDGSLIDDALPYIVTIASMFSVAYSLRFIRDVFFGPPPTELPRIPHEPPHWMRFPVELLVLACLVVGIVPGYTIGPFLGLAVHAVLGEATPSYSLAVWHGFTFPLLMSTVAFVGGVALYFILQPYLAKGEEGAPLLRRLKNKRIFERAVVVLSWRWARWLEDLLGTRRLQPQLLLIVCIALMAAVVPFALHGFQFGPRAQLPVDPAFALVWAAGLTCAVGAAYQAKYHRLAALVMLGGAGFATCITFVWLSAPDLALTQLLVEIVTTILILLGLRWLPKRNEEIPEANPIAARLRRLRDLALAIVAGAGMAALAFAMMTRPLPDSIARYFLQHAYSEGGGTNVVNVILVDFRSFDTFGEITVVGIVALTVYALLRRFRPAADSVDIPEQQRSADGSVPAGQKEAHFVEEMLVPAVIMKLLFPVIVVIAVFLFLRGHNLPGGGFVAGLTMALAIIVQYMASGARWVEPRLRVLPLRWMGFGLFAAAFTGIGALAAGYPFLTARAIDVPLPLIGPLHLSSVILFDLGVFAMVVGATVLILIALAHQSLRSHRTPRTPTAPATTPAVGTGSR
ncbi:MAG TPA: monovalent cation/H+ antiporter subunit A [Pseudolabrys sp.]|nr:monovalent cation/H+ antiporter subunit A [Pseudolabrys sp.]